MLVGLGLKEVGFNVSACVSTRFLRESRGVGDKNPDRTTEATASRQAAMNACVSRGCAPGTRIGQTFSWRGTNENHNYVAHVIFEGRGADICASTRFGI